MADTKDVKDTDKKKQDDAPKIVTVKSGLPKRSGADVVALWEKDPAHPADPENPDAPHEAYVAGDKPVKVALTSLVTKLIREGTLVEV